MEVAKSRQKHVDFETWFLDESRVWNEGMEGENSRSSLLQYGTSGNSNAD